MIKNKNVPTFIFKLSSTRSKVLGIFFLFSTILLIGAGIFIFNSHQEKHTLLYHDEANQEL